MFILHELYFFGQTFRYFKTRNRVTHSLHEKEDCANIRRAALARPSATEFSRWGIKRKEMGLKRLLNMQMSRKNAFDRGLREDPIRSWTRLFESEKTDQVSLTDIYGIWYLLLAPKLLPRYFGGCFQSHEFFLKGQSHDFATLILWLYYFFV